MITSAPQGRFDSLVFSAGSPFMRLTAELADIPPGADPIDLSVGEPRHALPSFVGSVLSAATIDFRRYPAIRGTEAFRRAVAAWIRLRFSTGDFIDPDRMILPLNGSREGLFFAALAAARYLGDKRDPAILLPNPYYQAYSAGAVMANVEPVVVPTDPATGLVDFAALDPALLSRTVAVYCASPANPQGGLMTADAWRTLLRLARDNCFLVFADECYSEIYRKTPPTGILEVAAEEGRIDLVVAFNSLSKRSNLPGLRCGFAAGDPDFLDFLVKLRNMAAPQVPIPVQSVAVAAYRDERHVAHNRRLYNSKYDVADELLAGRFDYRRPDGGFFLWLDVSAEGGGEEVARRLWREAGLKTIPGSYLSAADASGHNPGTPYLRLALVDDLQITTTALKRLVAALPA
ncbi:MAG: aminotransferase class I/II-fold pyridoxal phosphate-dependent enzyme [Hyphomicrobiales bacterium]